MFSYVLYSSKNFSLAPFFTFVFNITFLIPFNFQIEFFVNGRSKGIAFSDIYEGQYYPAISLFHDATIRCNFGPKFRHTMPKNTQPMSVRAEQMVVEQTVADIVDMVKCVEEREQMQQKEADDSMNGTHKIDPMET